MQKDSHSLIITGATGYLAANLLNFLYRNHLNFFSRYDAGVYLLDRTLKLERLDKGILELDLLYTQELSLEQFILPSLELGAVTVLHFANLNNLSQEEHFLRLIAGLMEKGIYVNFIYLSSSAVYGENASLDKRILPSKESDILSPISDYGKYKLEVERFVSKLFGKENSLIIRLANPYGGEFECKSVYQYFRQQLRETALTESLRVKICSDSPRQIVRDFVSIDEFLAIFWQLLNIYDEVVRSGKGLPRISKELTPSGILNLASGKGLFLEDFALMVKEEMLRNQELPEDSQKKEIVPEYLGLKEGDIKMSILSTEVLQGILPLSLNS